jgi:hypothetical protein
MISNHFARRIARRLPLVLAVVLLSATFASVATACPTCSQALADEQQGEGDIVAGYFWSILFMMSMPFLLVSSFCGYMYLEVRKARAAQSRATCESRVATCDGEDAEFFDERADEPAEVSA